MGLPATVDHPAANLLCHISGDDSDAIGGQLYSLASGSGVKQQSQHVIFACWSASSHHVCAWFSVSGQNPCFTSVLVLTVVELI